MTHFRAVTVYDKANLNVFKPMEESEKAEFYEKFSRKIMRERFEHNFENIPELTGR